MCVRQWNNGKNLQIIEERKKRQKNQRGNILTSGFLIKIFSYNAQVK